MFTRVVEIKCKAGKVNEVSSIASENVLPILKKQLGFQGEITLVSPADPSRMRSLSFWDEREDSERYQREQFPQIAEMLRPLCEGEPLVSTFEVSTSTIHDINLEEEAA
jgi:quinol monooxygenase YgiN